MATTSEPRGHPGLDRPEAYLPGDRRRALAAGRPLPDRATGGALFADIGGFTALTEALATARGARRGAEELSAHLDRVFHALIAEVHRYGGDVIYFAGDAVTCWLDGDDGRRAAAAALAMRAALDDVGRVRVDDDVTVQLTVKIAIGVGAVRRFVVGDPDVQLLDVLAGRVVDELADGERAAERGDVVVCPSAVATLAGVAAWTERTADDGRAVALLDRLLVDVAPAPAEPEPAALPAELVRPWLLAPVYERLANGQAALLAELRPAYPVFVRFGTIDFDRDPEAAPKLDRFVARAQAVLSAHGGHLLQIVLGDKGAYLYGVFGSPVAHEDDALRAAGAALELLGLTAETAVDDIRIGIAHGRLRSGTYGHADRRTFTCLGDAVNLAARLMAGAEPGTVRLTEEVQASAGDRLRCEDVGRLTVKGRVEPATVRELRAITPRPRTRELRYPLPMVGRAAELAAVDAARRDALAGRGRVVGVEAEPGRGKSRLLAEVLRDLRARGLFVAVGEAQSVAVSGSYGVWREVWQTLLGLDDETAADTVLRRVTAQLEAVAPGRGRRAPLLSPVLGVDLPDNDLTRAFSAQLRKSSLEAVLVELLEARARTHPIVLVLDDCQWMDALSRDLLAEVVRAVPDLPVLVLLTYRPTGRPWAGLDVDAGDHTLELVLGELDEGGARSVIDAKLRQLFGPDVTPAPALVAAVAERGQGNPFYLEELVSFVRSSGLDPADPATVARLELPDSLHRLVLGRLDTLPTAPFDTLKVASVIGRSFDAGAVGRVYPELGGDEAVDRHLGVARDAELVVGDRGEERSWLFRHQVVREVAYENLPFATRTMLHTRVGRHLEDQPPELVERDLDLLATHYGAGDDDAKKVEYLVRAGVAAQARYANESAADYLQRALPLVAEAERPGVRRRLGKVLEILGRWPDAEATFGAALDEAAAADDRAGAAWARTDLAEVLRKQGRFDEAARRLDEAAAAFTGDGDDVGLGLVLHLRGTLASQQARYDEARAAYEASLELRRRNGERAAVGSLLSNLAVVAESLGEFDRARRLNEEALAVREEVGDRWAIAVSANNVGMVALLQGDPAAARASFERALTLAEEVGDRWVAAVVHHNLGNAHRELGALADAAAELAAAMATYADHDDRWSMALLVEDAALVAAARGDAAVAVTLVAAADAWREAIAAPRPPATAAPLEVAMAPLTAQLSTDRRQEAERRGRTGSPSDLLVLVSALRES